jgi:hypothetical protein
MMSIIPIKNSDRTCGSCSTCCNGWLTGSAYGNDFWPGRKCFYLGESGCSIYGNHPQDPCKNYKCLWLANKNIPEWMKPNLSGVILNEKSINGIPYVEAVEAGEKMDAAVLNWIFTQYAEDRFKNIRYQIDGGWNWMGSPEFVEAIRKL